nr:MAG TPA: hypothetical protein [Caudoviricetes sp.]
MLISPPNCLHLQSNIPVISLSILLLIDKQKNTRKSVNTLRIFFIYLIFSLLTRRLLDNCSNTIINIFLPFP